MAEATEMSDLSNKVALVTGASRGAGRAIAIELGAAGATVYVTGRSTSERPAPDSAGGTVAETAEAVTAAGGKGVPILCDHRDWAQVQALVQRIRDDGSGIDLLVNNAWGGYEEYDAKAERRFWLETDVEQQWESMFRGSLKMTYQTTRAVAALMVEQQRGLIVNISAGDTTAPKFLGWMLYSVVKSSVDHLSRCVAQQLHPFGVACLTLYPGFMSTERVLLAFEGTPPEVVAEHGPKETPHYVGRAVVALAGDPEIMMKSGGTYMVGHLAREYGFVDLDGSQPEPFALPDSLLLLRPE